jgi:hypothetical protein
MLNALIEDSNDEEEHKEVFTLKHINTQLQIRVSRYFTVEEIKGGLDVDEINSISNIDNSPLEFNPFNDNNEFNKSLNKD